MTRTVERASDRAFAALLAGMLLAQLDTNVVVAAIPAIQQDFDLGSSVAGVTASTLLGVTVCTPVWGRLGDRVGSRRVFVASIAVFCSASVICAMASNALVLVLARALQGVGAGGLVVTAVSTVALIYDEETLVRRQIWLSAVFAISSLAGPPMGGVIATNWGWRWIFLINVPICLAALMLGWGSIPSSQRDTKSRFDVLGAVLIAIGGALLVALGTSQTLSQSWVASTVICAITLITAVILVRHERRAAAPLVPLIALTDKTLRNTVISTLLVGISLFGTFTFISLALSEGAHVPPGRVGAYLLALTGGQLIIVTTFSILIRRFRNLSAWSVGSVAMGVAGLALIGSLAFIPSVARIPAVVCGLLMAGAALGLSLQTLTLVAQSKANEGDMGAVMGILTFTRQLGGVIGGAGFGWLFILRGSAQEVVLAAALSLAVAFLFVPWGVSAMQLEKR